MPQGTLAERIRAGGAGIQAFYTPTGADTLLAEGRESRVINGRNCLLEYPILGDVALIDAWQADRWGNLTHRDSARNFNPIMAMAAEMTIVQTRHIVELGDMPPENVHTAGVFVQRVLHVPPVEEEHSHGRHGFQPLDRHGIAARIARDIPEGWFVNLGIGIPTTVSDFVPAEREVIFHAENGVIGIGPAPARSVNPVPGQCRHAADHAAHRRRLCPSRRQFRHRPRRASGSVRAGRVRGVGERRHRQLGSRRRRTNQTDRRRDGPRGRRQRLWVAMEHTTKGGGPASARLCTYPLTAKGVVGASTPTSRCWR